MTTEYVMVPREANPEMVAQAMKECAGMGAGSCGEYAGVDGDDMRAVWDAMLQAAPPARAPMADATTEQRVKWLQDNPGELRKFVTTAQQNADDYLKLNAAYAELRDAAPVAHSKSEYKRRVAMGDANVLPPAPVAYGSGDGYWVRAQDLPLRPDKARFTTAFYASPSPAPVFCEYCGGNDDDPPDHCMDCTRPGNTPVCSSCGGAGCQDCAPEASPSPAPVAAPVVTDAQIDALMRKADEYWEASTAARYRVRAELESVARAILAAQSGAGTQSTGE